jgi:nitrous oxidase accessory protein NosD
MYITYSSENIILRNSFEFNNYQVLNLESSNLWDGGEATGGNYWSDFQTRYPDAEELAGTGSWNSPYVIDDSNQDNYPLVSG